MRYLCDPDEVKKVTHNIGYAEWIVPVTAVQSENDESDVSSINLLLKLFKKEYRRTQFTRVLGEIERLDISKWSVKLEETVIEELSVHDICEGLKIQPDDLQDGGVPQWKIKLQVISTPDLTEGRQEWKPYNNVAKLRQHRECRNERMKFMQCEPQREGLSSNIENEELPPSAKKRKQPPEYVFVFYDMETVQYKDYNTEQPGSHIHEPILIVCQTVCEECGDEDDNNKQQCFSGQQQNDHDPRESNEECSKCGIYREKKQKVFDNVEAFFKYIKKLSSDIKDIYAVAHNGGKYDAVFILKHCVFKNIFPTFILKMIGSFRKITFEDEQTNNKLHFIDSMNFLAMKIREMPKTFGLDNIKKGEFPFLFLNVHPDRWHRTNAGKIIVDGKQPGPLPKLEAYNADYLTSEERDGLIQWYEQQRMNINVFDFHHDIKKYCEDDVSILRRSVLEFRRIFVRENDVDPILETTTLSGACLLTFKRNFLKPETIGVLPAGEQYQRYSRLHNENAQKYFLWKENRHGTTINIVNYHGVPAGLENETGILYFFADCKEYGCPKCHTTNRRKKYKDGDVYASLEDLYSLFKEAEEYARNDDSINEFIVKRECSFVQQIKTKPVLKEFVAKVRCLPQPLHPRDVFYGGRNEAFVQYHKCEAKEKIRYLDVCSLYPYIMKYGKYPIKHPEIILENFPDLQSFEGLILCDVLPPSKLYHPVLPFKTKEGLMFPLCKMCAENQQQSSCCHSEDERTLRGTWVVDEVRKAVQLGYKVLQIHEIWKYEITQFDKTNGKGGIFVEYINHFMKIKQESSGWPKWVEGSEDRDIYLQNYLENEGVSLDRNNIIINPGLRQMAKLCLNSLWSKIGQRTFYPTYEFISTKDGLDEVTANPWYRRISIDNIAENIVGVTQEKIVPSEKRDSNVVIAVYTTAQARLKLYEYMEQLQEKLLYCDTDSVIFVSSNDGKMDPCTGDFLGDMTDEIESKYGKGSFINEFVCGGTKNYAYTVTLPDGTQKSDCTIKGITQHYTNSKKLNFEVMKTMVLTGQPQRIDLPDRRPRVTPSLDIITKPVTMTYAMSFENKRRRIGSFNSLPFGYVD